MSIGVHEPIVKYRYDVDVAHFIYFLTSREYSTYYCGRFQSYIEQSYRINRNPRTVERRSFECESHHYGWYGLRLPCENNRMNYCSRNNNPIILSVIGSSNGTHCMKIKEFCKSTLIAITCRTDRLMGNKPRLSCSTWTQYKQTQIDILPIFLDEDN